MSLPSKISFKNITTEDYKPFYMKDGDRLKFHLKVEGNKLSYFENPKNNWWFTKLSYWLLHKESRASTVQAYLKQKCTKYENLNTDYDNTVKHLHRCVKKELFIHLFDENVVKKHNNRTWFWFNRLTDTAVLAKIEIFRNKLSQKLVDLISLKVNDQKEHITNILKALPTLTWFGDLPEKINQLITEIRGTFERSSRLIEARVYLQTLEPLTQFNYTLTDFTQVPNPTGTPEDYQKDCSLKYVVPDKIDFSDLKDNPIYEEIQKAEKKVSAIQQFIELINTLIKDIDMQAEKPLDAIMKIPERGSSEIAKFNNLGFNDEQVSKTINDIFAKYKILVLAKKSFDKIKSYDHMTFDTLKRTIKDIKAAQTTLNLYPKFKELDVASLINHCESRIAQYSQYMEELRKHINTKQKIPVEHFEEIVSYYTSLCDEEFAKHDMGYLIDQHKQMH